MDSDRRVFRHFLCSELHDEASFRKNDESPIPGQEVADWERSKKRGLFTSPLFC
jgi:hypothetical protein